MGTYDLGRGSFVSMQDGTDKDQNRGHQANQEGSSSIQRPNQTQGEQCSNYDSFSYNPFPFNVTDLRTNLFEEGGNDVPQPMDQYMEPAQYGDQDVLNNSTEVRLSDCTRQTDRTVYRINPRTSGKELWLEPRPDDRTYCTRARLSRPSRHSKDNSRARLKLGREEPKNGHAFSPGGPSGQSRVRPSPYRIGHSQFG